jgi:hypothetical protein
MKTTKKSMKQLQLIEQVLRDMERRGMVESRLGDDGKIYWDLTKKARHTNYDEWPDREEILSNKLS